MGSTQWGCTALGRLDPLDGKIAILDRGGPNADAGCTFVEKARNAQDAGAIGLLVANNTSNPELITPIGHCTGRHDPGAADDADGRHGAEERSGCRSGERVDHPGRGQGLLGSGSGAPRIAVFTHRPGGGLLGLALGYLGVSESADGAGSSTPISPTRSISPSHCSTTSAGHSPMVARALMPGFAPPLAVAAVMPMPAEVVVVARAAAGADAPPRSVLPHRGWRCSASSRWYVGGGGPRPKTERRARGRAAPRASRAPASTPPRGRGSTPRTGVPGGTG